MKWFKFVEQPGFAEHEWQGDEKNELQSLVEKIHSTYQIEKGANVSFLPDPSAVESKLVAFEGNLIVTPPNGLEIGYVPVVLRQAS